VGEGVPGVDGMFFIMKYNQIVQPVRVRQVRVTRLPPEECNVATVGIHVYIYVYAYIYCLCQNMYRSMYVYEFVYLCV
jgi:hypothetical protein